MDLNYLKELRPFLKALSMITVYSEGFKKKGEKIDPGIELGTVKLNLGGSFLLWRGAPMMNEWVKPYVDNVGQVVKLPGNNSCSLSPLVAFHFALKMSKL